MEFRLTDKEYGEFRELFIQSGTATVRRFIMDAYLKRNVAGHCSSGHNELFTQLRNNVRDIHSLSANVNQVAAKINSMKGDVSDLVLGYELKKALSYLSEISLMEECVVKAGERLIENFFAK